MKYGERGGFDGSSFRFSKEDKGNDEKNKVEKKGESSGENLNLDVVEVDNQETKFEVEITEADIEGIKYQIEEEREREKTEELGFSHRTELEAALGRMKKEAPELGIEEMELSDEDVKKYNEKKKIDIDKAVDKAINDKTKEGEDKGWDKETLEEEIESAKEAAEIGVEGEQASYLKDIYGEERLREKGLELSNEKWGRMEKGLEYAIKNKDWNDVITRAGQMNNLDSEKFKELKDSDRTPFDADVKKSILQEIDSARKGEEGTKQEANPGKLAKDIEQVAKCFPDDLGREIEISGKDWKIMEDYLDEVRKQDWGRKELTDFGKKGEYWKVAQTEASMKEIEKMIKKGEIKVSKELDNEKDSAVK